MKTIFHNASAKIVQEDRGALQFYRDLNNRYNGISQLDEQIIIKLSGGRTHSMPYRDYVAFKQKFSQYFGSSMRNTAFALYHHLLDQGIAI